MDEQLSITETKEASLALDNWFKSQGISPHQSMYVLMMSASSVIVNLSSSEDKAKLGIELANKMLTALVKAQLAGPLTQMGGK